ncbi:MAG: iron-containing alcohol dehydrogenase [Acidobacteriota bacterium]
MLRLTESIDRLLGAPIEGCACGRLHRPATGRVALGPGLIDSVNDLLPVELPRNAALLVLADSDTESAAGRRVIERLRAGGRTVREAILPRHPHADDITVASLRHTSVAAGASIPDAVIAVGSGTIGDIGKALAFEWQRPLVTVGTAASMNGYTSPIVALTVNGLKRTLPSKPPRVLVLDTEVLANAPARMTRAGFGDLISKPVSGADWMLSHWLGFDSLCPTALSLADEAVSAARTCAAGIGRADRDAVGTLAAALVVSGFAMDVAGMSSPASGGEHLISHYLDISAHGWQREPWLHGEQVAVGTALSLALYARLRALGASRASDAAPLDEDDDEVRRLHAHLDPGARHELVQQAAAKRLRVPQRGARRALYAARWDELWATLDTQLSASDGLHHDLALAGVNTRFDGIAVTPAQAQHTARYARHMRDRYTVLDFAADLGVAADEVISW